MSILRKSSLATLALVMSASVALPAWALEKVAREKTLILMPDDGGAPQFRNPGQLNPYLPSNLTFRWSGGPIMEPLFYYNSLRDEIIPWVAEGFQYNDDFTEVTVNLRDGVKWSDGEQFTADDVVFTYNMLLENGNGAGGLMHSSDVVDRVASVTVVDPLTVSIKLTRPDSRYAFRHLINHFGKGLFWLPEHVWVDKDPLTFNNYAEDGSLPVVTGAWKVARSTPQQIILDRRDDWWGAETGFRDLPDVARVINIPKTGHDRAAQMVVSGDVDMTGDLVSAPLTKSVVESADNVTTFSGDEPPYGNLDWWPNSLYMNHKTGTWDDVRLRRTLNYYVNQQQLVDIAYLGANPVSRTPFPAFGSMAPYIEDSLELAEKYEIGVFDPAKGDALMEEMGYAKNSDGMWEKDGKTVTGSFHGLALFEAVGPIIAQQLRDSGIDVEFQTTTESRGLMVEGKTELSIFGHRGGVADPYDTLDLYHCKNAVDVGKPLLILDRWCNEEYSAIVDQIGLISPDDPQMRPLVRKAMEIWYENAVEVPLNQWVHRIPYNTTYWDNYPTTENPYMQPAFWFASGQFGYVLHNLEAKQ